MPNDSAHHVESRIFRTLERASATSFRTFGDGSSFIASICSRAISRKTALLPARAICSNLLKPNMRGRDSHLKFTARGVLHGCFKSVTQYSRPVAFKSQSLLQPNVFAGYSSSCAVESVKESMRESSISIASLKLRSGKLDGWRTRLPAVGQVPNCALLTVCTAKLNPKCFKLSQTPHGRN